MLLDLLILVAGAGIILYLSDQVIRSLLTLAGHFKLSGGFIGLTAMSIGTSIPEIITHIAGSLTILKEPAKLPVISGLVIGANIGSDIFQQNFLLAVIGLISIVAVKRKDLNRMIGALIGAAIMVLLFSIDGHISRLEGAILVLLYIAYLWYLKTTDKKEQPIEHQPLQRGKVLGMLAIVVIGFTLMGFVAKFVLGSAENLVAVLPVSASMLGLLLLGTASALPELATSLLAIKKGQKDMSAGILIGSNVTNPLFGIGIGAAISTYTVPHVVVWYDLPLKILTAGLIYWFLWRNGELKKRQAITLLSLFFGYLIIRFLFFPVDM